MAILAEGDFTEVRAAIDTSITATDLPDAIISMGIYQGMAERELYVMYPLLDGETDPVKLTHIKRAAIFLLASYLVNAVPLLTKESLGIYSYTRKTTPISDQAANLRGMAITEMGYVIDANLDANIRVPTFIAIAHGCRGS